MRSGQNNTCGWGGNELEGMQEMCSAEHGPLEWMGSSRRRLLRWSIFVHERLLWCYDSLYPLDTAMIEMYIGSCPLRVQSVTRMWKRPAGQLSVIIRALSFETADGIFLNMELLGPGLFLTLAKWVRALFFLPVHSIFWFIWEDWSDPVTCSSDTHMFSTALLE